MSSFSYNSTCNSNNNNNYNNNNNHNNKNQNNDTNMCQSTRRLSMLIESPQRTTSTDTDEDCNSSVQGTITSTTSSNKMREDEGRSERADENDVKKCSNSNYDQHLTTLDDGDIHFYDGNDIDDDNDGDDNDGENKKDGDSKKTMNKRRHGHHRSLSGLFSENAFISEGGTGGSVGDSAGDSAGDKMPLPFAKESNGQLDNARPQENDGISKSTTSTPYPSQQSQSWSNPQDTLYDMSSNKSDASPMIGKKHRRIYSGGVSNPSMAHRRINSRGNAFLINRMNAGAEPRHALGNGTNQNPSQAMPNYISHSQQYHQQYGYMHGRSSRSLSPKPSPKCYSTHDMVQSQHCRDDSDLHKYSSQHDTSNMYRKHHSIGNNGSLRRKNEGKDPDGTNTTDPAKKTKPFGGMIHGDEKIAAAQWLQHFRKSSPLDYNFMEYVESNPNSTAAPREQSSESMMKPCHLSDAHPSSRHSFPPSNKPSGKIFSRSSSVAGSRSGSPLQSFYDNSAFTYSPFDFGGEKGSLPSMPSLFRQSSNSSSIGSVPPTSHHLRHHHQQQQQPHYPTQQLQANRESSRNYHELSMHHYHRDSKQSSMQGYPYYPQPRGANTMRTSSTVPNYPVQQQNNHPFYQPVSNSQHYHRSSYIAATHAARDAALGLPPHPLAMEGGPPQRRHHQSSTSIESKIETDELLFQKESSAQQMTEAKESESAKDGYNSYQTAQTSTQQPHYRMSPKLFEESLKDLPTRDGGEGGERSPTLHFSSSYQESLLSSLVGQNTHSSSQQQQQNVQKQDTAHHHRNSSVAIIDSLVHAIDESDSKSQKSHKRVSSTGTLILDDDLLGEKLLDVEPIQPITSNDVVQQPQRSQLESKKKIPNITKTQLRSRQKQALPKSQATNSTSFKEIEETQPTKPANGRKITGTVSKRVRRKCNVDGCNNRVVQGGLCISHGAKRKKCRYPGCTKHVKKAGMCSTHGPARKRCEIEGCEKVAVQGGKCIAHGAKKKLCKVDDCQKQAILSGMCKKHHDMDKAGKLNFQSTEYDVEYCRPVSNQSSIFVKENEGNLSDNGANHGNSTSSKSSHRRGLSIFQDMSAVNTIIGSSSEPTAQSNSDSSTRSNTSTNEARGRRAVRGDRRNGHNRGLSIFAEDEVVNKIVQNEIGI